MQQAILIGYGGHGFVAADILKLAGYELIGYCDHAEKEFNPFKLDYLGKEQDYFSSSTQESTAAFVAIGDHRLRQHVYEFLQSRKVSIINAIHPKATVAGFVNMGKGIFIAANVAINPACTIGDGVICNTSSSIDHECSIGNFTHICPGTVLCGNVRIGNNSFIGAGSVIKPGIKIGDNVIIGAGSVVVSDLISPGVYFGNPAILKIKDES